LQSRHRPSQPAPLSPAHHRSRAAGLRRCGRGGGCVMPGALLTFPHLVCFANRPLPAGERRRGAAGLLPLPHGERTVLRSKTGEGESEAGIKTKLLKNNFVQYQSLVIFPEHFPSAPFQTCPILRPVLSNGKLLETF
jgi:hypothetical protein